MEKRNAVKQLNVYGYTKEEDEWGESTLAPSWEQVEAALRSLDADRVAGMVLHLHERSRTQPAMEYFDVHGGPDGYFFGYYVGTRQLYFTVPGNSEPGKPTGIVLRDQGLWVPACHVCRDLELVVEAARWFFQYCEPHPEINWGRFAG